MSPLEELEHHLERAWLASLSVPPGEFPEGAAYIIHKIGLRLPQERFEALIDEAVARG